MTSNPYSPPESDVQSQQQSTVPQSILKKIKAGWIVAIISGIFTTVVMVMAITNGMMGDLFGIWSAIDVVLIFALAYGIYRKSRFAASVMFIYFLASKIWIIVETGKPSGLVISLIFLYFYFQAMLGTFQYHKHIKNTAS